VTPAAIFMPGTPSLWPRSSKRTSTGFTTGAERLGPDTVIISRRIVAEHSHDVGSNKTTNVHALLLVVSCTQTATLTTLLRSLQVTHPSRTCSPFGVPPMRTTLSTTLRSMFARTQLTHTPRQQSPVDIPTDIQRLRDRPGPDSRCRATIDRHAVRHATSKRSASQISLRPRRRRDT
jgi:hypothetical protein